METAMRVLICASEAMPYAKTGGLADVAGSLPKALHDLGHDVRLALPKYRSVYEGGFATTSLHHDLPVPLGDRILPVSIETTHRDGIITYLVVSDEHFRRPGGLYGYPDDDARFIVYMRGILAALAAGDWRPDIIHCNDWQTGLLPVYLRTAYRDSLGDVASLYTVHNLAYQGNFAPQVLELAGLGYDLYDPQHLEFYGGVSFMKGGLVFADLISTVSPTYAVEIQQPEYGERLDGVLRERADRLRGILNGIDYDYWNPATDPNLPITYTAETVGQGKAANKAALQARLGLERSDAPLLALISRLTSQKGLDLVEGALPGLLDEDFQFVVLGTGDPHYEQMVRDLAARHPDRISATIGFDEPLAHQIYAGADFFLMPSAYEPCGLGQMISMRYGTIPVVRRTGGLADTVVPFDENHLTGNGFSFPEYRPEALAARIRAGLAAYRRPAPWQALRTNALQTDFSWARSAAGYVDAYRTAVELHRAPVAG